MSRLHVLGIALVAAVAAACGGSPPPRAPSGPARPLAAMLVEAVREEAHGDPARAVERYLDVVDAAGESPNDPASPGAAMAALDALVTRSPTALDDASRSAALANRAPKAARALVEVRLAKAVDAARGPFVSGLAAEALSLLALQRGDAPRAESTRARSGCARSAAMRGPTSLLPVSGVGEKSPLDPFDAPLPEGGRGPGPFPRALTPVVIHAAGCHLPLHAETPTTGVREVIVDVEVPTPQWIGLRLVSPAAASLAVGGRVALQRGPDMPGYVARLTQAEIRAPGWVRVVAKVGMDEDFQSVVLNTWGQDGQPLRARVPAPGSRATAASVHVRPIELADTARGARVTDGDRVASALASLAAGDSGAAEDALFARAKEPDAPPELLLAYGRALRATRTLPSVKMAERARATFDRVVEKWPDAWEAVLERAVLAGERRGASEARLAAIGSLDGTRGAAGASPMFDAFEAALAAKEGLHDRARAAYARAEGPLAGTPLLRDVERTVFDRVGREAVDFECAPRGDGGASRSGLECYHALVAVGDRDAAEQELSRIRALYGAAHLYQTLSQRDAIERGDRARLERAVAAADPSARSLASLFALKGELARADVLVHATSSRDAPRAIAAIMRSLGDDPAAAFDAVTRAALDAPTRGDGGEATVVLAHREVYDLRDDGLLHWVLLDVRRVHGTTDVDSNAQASSPMVFGRDAARVLRRRIFKKDGRVLLPDSTPGAAQAHADLSQLEAGDAVEAVYEGWSVPQENGHLGIDTPDLLPERTGVRNAKVELRLPPKLRVSLFSHPLLGKARETTDAGRRVLTWSLDDAPVRRIETGIPRMDRAVAVSLSTATWEDVAAGMRDVLLTLSTSDAEVSAWAREAAGTRKPSEELVSAIVTAAGAAVKEATGAILSDVSFGRAALLSSNARASLATHEGSRTWLVVRALRELGVQAEVVVAEDHPFSDRPDFPAHYGRFTHPLARVRLPAAGGPKEIWIDADVSGPPLPAGRISPELRGRAAISADGKIFRLPDAAGGGGRDEIDIRLTVDAAGDAHGTLTAILEGRAAQDLSDALVHIVGDERQRALRGIVLAWVPHATVDTVSLSSSEGSWQVAIRAELTVGGYAQIEGTKPENRAWVLPGLDTVHYVYPRPYVSSLGSSYASQGARENALAVNRAIQYHVRRQVELPPNAAIARLPGPFRVSAPLIEAERRLAVRGQTIEEDFTLRISTGTVPRDQYGAFVADAHKTDDAFRGSTRVRPPPK